MVWEQYCCFCGAYVNCVRDRFIDDIKDGFKGSKWPPGDGQWRNPKGFPVPDRPIREIMLLTHEDDQFFDGTVIVSPIFEPAWVSRPVDGGHSELYIGETDYGRIANPSNVVHLGCLSILCRRLDVTPEQWWLSFYGPNSNYLTVFPWEDRDDRLKRGIYYYDMEKRYDVQSIHYAPERSSKKGRRWWNPADYEDCNWIFAMPSKFPPVPDLPPPLQLNNAPNATSTQHPAHHVIFTPDLLYIILDYAVPYVDLATLADELTPDEWLFDSPTIIDSIRTLLAMIAVNRQVHNLIIQTRQNLFFRIIWQLGYMLPACPLDWRYWNQVNGPLPPLTGVPVGAIPGPANPTREMSLTNAKDWRAYMIIYLRRDDRHARSRYRFHRLHTQYARGIDIERENGTTWKYWSCGRFGVGTALECPEPYEWETFIPSGSWRQSSDYDDLRDPTQSEANTYEKEDTDEEDGPDEDEDEDEVDE